MKVIFKEIRDSPQQRISEHFVMVISDSRWSHFASHEGDRCSCVVDSSSVHPATHHVEVPVAQIQEQTVQVDQVIP